MRTSKKLLSFFLAVVMVITTCSVGFTAFAQDNSNSIWKTEAEAKDAFDTLNELANQLPKLLMGIDNAKLKELIADPVYEKYAKADGKTLADLTKTDKEKYANQATMQDLLGCLQPLLIGLLNSQSQEAFLKWFAGKYPSYKDAILDSNGNIKNASAFDYLNDNGSNQLSYYQLVILCDTYKDADNTGTLAKWYDELIPLAMLYPEIYNRNAENTAAVEAIAEQIRGHVIVQPGKNQNANDYSYYNATLYDLKNFEFDYGENKKLVDKAIADYNKTCDATGNPFKANDFAEYVYYALGAGYDLSYSHIAEYYNALKTVKTDVTYKGTANIYGINDTEYNITKAITLDNYAELFREATLKANNIESAADYIENLPANVDELVAEAEQKKAEAEAAKAEAEQKYADAKEKFDNGKDGDTEGYYAQVDALFAAYEAEWATANNANKKRTTNNKYFGGGNAVKQNINNIVRRSSLTAGLFYDLNQKYKEEIAIVENWPAYEKNAYDANPAGSGMFKPASEYDKDINEAQAVIDKYSERMYNEDYAKSYMDMKAIKFLTETVLYTNDGANTKQRTIGNSIYYTDIINAMVIQNSNATSVEDVTALAAAKMPDGKAESQLTADEIEQMANVCHYARTPGLLTDDFWTDGEQEVKINDTDTTVLVKLPATLVGTAVARYFGLINGNFSQEATNHRLGLYEAFEQNKASLINAYYAEAFEYARSEAAREVLLATGNVNNIGFKAKDTTKLNETLDLDGYIFDANNAAAAKLGLEEEVSLSKEQDATLKADYTSALMESYSVDADGKETIGLGTAVLNEILNTTIVSLITDPSKNPINKDESLETALNGLFVTKINLTDVLTDVWKDLVKSPVEKLVNLLPLLVTAIDEVLLPFVLSGEGDQYHGLLTGIVPNLIGSAENGSYIGVDTFNFDLNVLLPNLMHWLLGNKEGIPYWNGGEDVTRTLKAKNASNDFVDAVYKVSDFFNEEGKVKSDIFDHYVVKDNKGNTLTRVVNGKTTTYKYLNNSSSDLAALLADAGKTTFNCYFTYEGNVPYLTGIYLADKALRDAKISDMPSVFGKLLDYEDKKDAKGNVIKDENGDAIKVLKKDDNGKDIKTPSAGANILAEVVTEVATLFTAAVDEFVANDALINAPKYDAQNALANKGLNNIFVALPQLFDLMEDLAAEKYGVAKDAWAYCYEGKMVASKLHEDQTLNADLEAFKSYASNPDSVGIFDCFSGIFVEDWLNAIFSLINNVVSTDNKISENLPIVMGLLNALGGFGEDSIITDVINGVFQIEREDADSFTFEKRANGLTGLSKNHAYFLISNINTLIDVIKNLAGTINAGVKIDGKGLIGASKKSASSSAPTLKNAKANSKTYTKKELSNTTDLINNLDKLLSSLLSDSTLNGFKLDSTDNILAGVVTFFSNYLGSDCYSDLARLVNDYTFYITGKETHKANGSNNVDAKKVYTNDSMTGLMVETFLLIEKVVENLFGDFNGTYTLDNGKQANYNLIVEAIEGLISPDAICVRLDGYDKVAKQLTKYNCWHNAAAKTSRGNYKISLDWGIKAGDKDAFFAAFASSLRLVTSILGVVLVDTGWYGTVVNPVLNALCKPNGIKVDTAAEYGKLTNGYHDEALLGLMAPIASWLNSLLNKPASTLIKSVQGIAGLLDDKTNPTIASIVKGAITPLVNEVNGLANIFGITSDKLLATSPTLKKTVNDLASDINKYSDVNNIKIKNISLSGNNIIPIINVLLKDTGISLKQISWSKLANAKTPAAALVYVLDYLLENILSNSNLTALAKLINNDVATLLLDALKSGKIKSTDLLALLNKVLEVTDSPTLVYWTFAQYLQEATEKFVYPKGVTKQMADSGVTQLDSAISSILQLLGSLGVDLGADNLQGIISKNLFTNKLLTTIATALYGALDGLDPTIKEVLSSLGIVSSTKDIAKILTDKSYGQTFSSAAKIIKAQSSWKKVKNVNWGFKDGSAKAQQGFVNALAAILRPLDNVLEIFLNEGTLELNDVLYNLITTIEVKKTTTTLNISDGDVPIAAKITYSMSNGVFTLSVRESKDNRELSRPSKVVLDLTSLKDTLSDLKIEGTNGYNSAIIPLLEALGCTNLKTYKQYQKDADKAKDNMLLNILNPLIGDSSKSFLNKLCANPISELTKLLPNIAMYLDAHGLMQMLSNLLAPVTELVYAAADTLKLDKILEDVLGMPIGDLIGSLLGLGEGKINLKLSDLTVLNIEDLIIPIVNMVLKSVNNKYVNALEIADIDWNALISLGTKTTYQSKAIGENGKFLKGKRVADVDQGKVLIAVLRYVANVLVDNSKAIKNLVCNIDAIKKNDMISSIVKSVFATLSTASGDQIVAALFYLIAGEPTNAFWDYSAYKTGSYSFSYPQNLNVDFVKSLPPMLDGLIGSLLDLNETISKALFKDDLIGKLATGLYGAVEGVKVGDGSLTALLAQTGIDFSTENVAKLLTDASYGKSYEGPASVIKSAGSWANVKAESLKWGVTDRDSFFHALAAVLRPVYGVLDVLLNDASLGIFDIVRIPGSNGYTAAIVPLLEAFNCYNVKTQYQYRQDINKEYDSILLDIINPIWDKVEDILAAPLQTVTATLPNLALFIGNDGLCQILDNMLTPVSALLDAVRPIVDVNELLGALLPALNVDLNGLLGKIGITNFNLDIYDINETLKPVLGGDAIIPLVNNVLGMIDIKGAKLNLKLNDVDWLQLASHGKTIVSASQAATYGARIYVEGDASETLIAILRYLIATINSGENLDVIMNLIGGLLGNADEGMMNTINSVLDIIKGEPDTVIEGLLDLLESIAG
ncbi:MAG: hypothetical protein NC213_01545 [Acetobacter sp.]|nr:hypothetical protein [Bacteroides sp.]MCM1340411.1 hypothetical protein [Acetobacter sp.]MCM1432942.1 hypothetical protein [Clostridiales bacterium]